VRYQALTRDDFWARRPPPGRLGHASGFGALSCVRLAPELPQAVMVDRDEEGNRRARAPRAAYHAELDRHCSWWNPRTARGRTRYLLEHEQVHFAIVEVHARSLTLRVRALAVPVAARRDATAALRRRITELVDSTVAEIQRESDAFDRETSRRYATRTQARWLERLEPALRETEHVRR
jgi:hypothetical protein